MPGQAKPDMPRQNQACFAMPGLPGQASPGMDEPAPSQPSLARLGQAKLSTAWPLLAKLGLAKLG